MSRLKRSLLIATLPVRLVLAIIFVGISLVFDGGSFMSEFFSFIWNGDAY